MDATGWIRNVYGRNDDAPSDLPDGWGLLQRINRDIRERQPRKITIAEDSAWITRPVDGGGAGFGAQWGAGFLHRLRAALVTPDDGARDIDALASVIGQRFNDDAFQRVIYTESHDEVDFDASAADAMDAMPCGGGLGIGPYTCLILSQDA